MRRKKKAIFPKREVFWLGYHPGLFFTSMAIYIQSGADIHVTNHRHV